MICPFRLNSRVTAPCVAMVPPFLVTRLRISEAVRLRLSVLTSTSTATPPGA